MKNDFILRLKKRFENEELPGSTAQYKMAPEDRDHSVFLFPHTEKPRTSAVLLLLYTIDKKIHTMFIKRPIYDGAHGGQISLPGGKSNPEDKSITETALREAYEETGIDPKQVEIIGKLTMLYIPVSHIHVTPLVGYYSHQPAFIPDPMEAEDVIEISLDKLFSSENIQKRKLQIRQYQIEAPGYLTDKGFIWGATAMILSEFYEVILHCGSLKEL